LQILQVPAQKSAIKNTTKFQPRNANTLRGRNPAVPFYKIGKDMGKKR
jgi:hypothetical protein